MAEWWIEAGIGETRAALIEDGRIIAARLERSRDGIAAGAVVDARCADRAARTIELPGGQLAVLAQWPAAASVSTPIRIRITRMALRERARTKVARAVVVESDTPLSDGNTLARRCAASGLPVQMLTPHGPDQLERAGWSEMLDGARTGCWPFDGGCLWIDATPAMTVIDIDGDAPDLAMRGVAAALDAITAFDIGGPVAIDVPGLASRAERLRIGELVDARLSPPFERTAVNGFGLLQIVRPRTRPSLIEQMQFDPVGRDAALLLRQAQRSVGQGTLELVARPPVADLLRAEPEWLAVLEREVGRAVSVTADAQVKGAGHAQ